MKSIGKVKVLSAETKQFTKESGEVIQYALVTGMTDDNQIFMFTDYKGEPQPGWEYDMSLGHDNKLRAKVIYNLVKQ